MGPYPRESQIRPRQRPLHARATSGCHDAMRSAQSGLETRESSQHDVNVVLLHSTYRYVGESWSCQGSAVLFMLAATPAWCGTAHARSSREWPNGRLGCGTHMGGSVQHATNSLCYSTVHARVAGLVELSSGGRDSRAWPSPA